MAFSLSLKLFKHLNYANHLNHNLSKYGSAINLIQNRYANTETTNAVREPIVTGGPKRKVKDATTDRRVPIEPDVSIRYMKSKAYRETYYNYKVWGLFRRNFKGQISPLLLRKTCVGEDGYLNTSNPCPICRDEYLVLHYKNILLLNQFISENTGELFPATIMCLCEMQYEKLLVAVNKARDYGLMSFPVPLREYDYSQYYPKHFHK